MSFNDMVQKQREGQLKKNLSSVGPSYQLDYERISDEMVQLIINSKMSNGDYELDEYTAYDKWQEMNYDIIRPNEDGDSDYDDKLIDMVETKFYNYKDKMEEELMDRVYDIQYNDLIAIAGRELYAKSTNGNDSYLGCKIWAGPDKDDDRGWYFNVDEFVRVIEPSYSGESIFGF